MSQRVLRDADPPVHATIIQAMQHWGISPDAVVAPVQGEANHTVLLGDRLVLRIPRDGGTLSDDLRKEAEVIPVMVAEGVQTSPVMKYESAGVGDGRPLMVMERAPGRPWAPETPTSRRDHDISRHLGGIIRRLHNAALLGDPRLPSVPIDRDTFDPRGLLPGLTRTGVLEPSVADGLRIWLDHLAAFRPERPPLVLIHGDVAPGNIVVTSDGAARTTLIDWGDAAFADPAMDFAKLPLATLPDVVDGYLAAPGVGDLTAWLARALWYHVAWGVAALARDGVSPARAGERLAVVLRHFATDDDPAWDGLRPPVSDRTRRRSG